MLIAALTAINT